jgi:phospholipid transport system substrate-binding protein
MRNAERYAGRGVEYMQPSSPHLGVRLANRQEHSVKKLWQLLIALVLATSFAVQAADGTPDAIVKSTVDDVLGVIKQHKDKRALQDLAEKKVVQNFDFARMTQLAVGRAWRDATAEQRASLEQAFRSLLVTTYTAALAQTSGDTPAIEVKPAQLEGEDALVRTVVRQSGKQPFAIDYRMTKSGSGWKVYDVVVENLSLVTNYRSSFASEVSRSGVDGLIKTLQEKNRQLAQG